MKAGLGRSRLWFCTLSDWVRAKDVRVEASAVKSARRAVLSPDSPAEEAGVSAVSKPEVTTVPLSVAKECALCHEPFRNTKCDAESEEWIALDVVMSHSGWAHAHCV